eukprot:TRINITY_DN36591_c0_g1_i3.p3 TRINITY_DN36591_c0_g1~~TRINITY_DN36591_c0_g1_i3.p3  ORF type:complete len:141 (+),score=20.42 TRINITY_DN36591_c0_g1_i3:619-1041(+)
MHVLPFSALPSSRGKNVTVIDSGGDTRGFDNFNLSIDPDEVPASGAVPVHLNSGGAELHSAWTVHRSGPNLSSRRRMAFIIRYVPSGTVVVPGKRGSFGADYYLAPVSGRGASSTPRSPAPAASPALYTPCFGNQGAFKV